MDRPRFTTELISPSDLEILRHNIVLKNGRVVPNRFVKAPMCEQTFTFDDSDFTKRGIPTSRVLNAYEKWAHGGFGMIVSGNVIVDPIYLDNAGNCVISKENDSAELREQLHKWSTAIKAEGALAILQLSHGSPRTPKYLTENPLAPSAITLEDRVTKALTEEQVQTEVIDRFAYAAEVAFQSGFDGVEISAVHMFLLGHFLSPKTNFRTDKYGGSMDNRQRILHDIYNAIRQGLGPEGKKFVIGIKLMSVSFQDGSLDLNDAEAVAMKIVETGFDYVSLSGGCLEQTVSKEKRETTEQREDFYLKFSDKVVPIFNKGGVLVCFTGGFRTAAGMVEAIKRNYTDLIGLGRPATAEPDIARKLLDGEVSSTLATKFDENDFITTIMAARTQIYQMGEQSLLEVDHNCGAGISDFTITEEADNYKKQLWELVALIKASKGTSKNVPHLFPYKSTVVVKM